MKKLSEKLKVFRAIFLGVGNPIYEYHIGYHMIRHDVNEEPISLKQQYLMVTLTGIRMWIYSKDILTDKELLIKYLI
jgi:hypothetical protein